MESEPTKEELEQAFRLGYTIEGPRALLAALIDMLGSNSPSDLAFRKDVYDRVGRNIAVAPDGTDPEVGRQVFEGAQAAAAELLKIHEDPCWPRVVRSNDND